jgi:hypothetical protein
LIRCDVVPSELWIDLRLRNYQRIEKPSEKGEEQHLVLGSGPITYRPGGSLQGQKQGVRRTTVNIREETSLTQTQRERQITRENKSFIGNSNLRTS